MSTRLELGGFSSPHSPEGRANLVGPPPWHYVGDLLVVEYSGRSSRGGRRAAGRPRAASGVPDGWLRCSSTGSRERAGRVRTGRSVALGSTRSSSSPSTRSGRVRRSRTAPIYGWIATSRWRVSAGSRAFRRSSGSIWMTRTFGLERLGRPWSEDRGPHTAAPAPPTSGASREADSDARAPQSGTAPPTTRRRS